ncbi:cyclin-L1 [Histomonas meleagridis]|uniref:cyclin-L1 n=1 Tax=Histomonas meleagridis TaxID=135588 RepID=UPI00355AA0DC|nr:cyclin-L1 [Histomonas meleagridis]KAH0801121.1 cyclin-L1 [Histomonas meleagridis]
MGETSKRRHKIYELPEDIAKSTIALQMFLAQQPPELSCPPARASAMFYFKKTYQGQRQDDISLIYFQVASLHLASKVFDKPRSLQKMIIDLETAQKQSNIISLVPSLKLLSIKDPDFRQVLTKNLIQAENDIIYRLDFHFDIPLPYPNVQYLTDNLTHWHISRSDQLFLEFKKEICEKSFRFLNDLQGSPLFYQYPPDIVAEASVYLTFEKLGAPLINPHKMKWYEPLLPFRDINEVEEANKKIYGYFKSMNVMRDKVKMDTPIDPSCLLKFHYVPLEDVDIPENMCPPPPLELVKSFAGPFDTFNNQWSEHKPKVPPPPADLMEMEVRKANVTFPKKQRTRSEETLNNLLYSDSLEKENQFESAQNMPKRFQENSFRQKSDRSVNGRYPQQNRNPEWNDRFPMYESIRYEEYSYEEFQRGPRNNMYPRRPPEYYPPRDEYYRQGPPDDRYYDDYCDGHYDDRYPNPRNFDYDYDHRENYRYPEQDRRPPRREPERSPPRRDDHYCYQRPGRY